MRSDDRWYRPRVNPGYLMVNPKIMPDGFGFVGDPDSIAKLKNFHITIHIDCDHWWTLAEARILKTGFDISEQDIRICQNFPPLMKEGRVRDLQRSQRNSHSTDDDFFSTTHASPKHWVLIELEAFDGKQSFIGQHPKQAHVGDVVCLPHWGYFFSIWPEGKTRRNADCPQKIYEQGSMRTTVTRPPKDSKIH